MTDIQLEDLNVLNEETLITPAILKDIVPGSTKALATVAKGRTAVKNIIARDDRRLFLGARLREKTKGVIRGN